MMTAISILCAVCFVFLQLVFLNGTTSAYTIQYTNSTDHSSPLKSGRLKRSLDAFPVELNIRVQYETGEEVNLRWSIVISHLANDYLPVALPFGYPSENVMKDVGGFVMYHDKSKCSAVVYFEKLDALYGVIGVDHYIEALPFLFDDEGVYQSGVADYPHVKTRENSFFHISPKNVFPPPSDTDAWVDFVQTSAPIQNQAGCNAAPTSTHQHTGQDYDEDIDEEEVNQPGTSTTKNYSGISNYKQYFLEILVLVTVDITELFKWNFGEDHFIEWLIRYYIIYFNAVDMMFQSLRNAYGGVRLNIAKIVIEDELEPFDFMSNGELQFIDIKNKVPQYLQNHQIHYTPDSFDHVFIHTSRSIMDNIVPVNGMSKYGYDLYESRKYNQYYDVVPITIVRYQNDYADYLVTIHEISRTLKQKIDSKSNGLTLVGQCHSIMQREGPKCDNCLKWSNNGRRQFKAFLRDDRNRCFFLNEPRSLRPPGVSKFMTANRQCQCFGYLTYFIYPSGCAKKFIGMDKCAEPMQCTKLDGGHLHTELTVRPFDGTPATVRKVCWNGVSELLPRTSKWKP